ncbi:Serpentine receptor class delta-59 [Caenorhabditis elegans]|uniref:Serpentine receptor class delta-59 n=1 Tax=Caenorhabditis elegans TaxID=6239 RepID=SRD59_CAEEL|nr:Serpentine receptor class delta-59 [Caenorhabditis elegans]Q19061.2 RecName: Full=Serpentine receptor class delta-59; Short=Protein srd-59 [Caenorhabditis elegans]CCD65897.1 Serpentine receptor class delta-59 [Caenorhabditis elegans]|eukprot:NP_495499.1 Serpentine receptor class delta-59 [Caenorhabditis elegans]
MCSNSNCYVPFFNWYWPFCGVLAIIFQTILLHLISHKSPATLDGLKIFLYNTSCVQIALITFAFLSQHRLLTNSISAAVLSLGPCSYVSPTTCFINYHVFMATSFGAGSAIAITVLFRFFVLVQNQVHTNQTYIMVLASYIAPLVVLIIPFTDKWDFESAQASTALEHPSYNLSIYYPYSGFSNAGSPQFLSATLLLSIGAYGIPIGCLILTRKVLILIRYHSHMSERTKKQAQTLIHGLIVQSMLPFISYIPSFSGYIYTQSTGRELLICEHLILVSSAFPALLDPFISFYFIVPYRQAIIEWVLPKRQQRITTVTSNSTSGFN